MSARLSPPPTLPAIPWLRLVCLWALSRTWVVVVGILGHMALPKGEHYGPAETISFWRLALRWDGNWYWGIATNGYHFQEGVASAPAFFPGYPWLMKALNTVIFPFTTQPLSGVLISNLGLFFSGVMLWRLACAQEVGRPHREERADLAATLLYFGPVSLFFSVVYTEGLFLCACLGCFVALREKRFWLAGFCGFWAALTRNGGAFLVVPLLWTAWEARREGNRSWAPWLACGLPLLGSATFALYLAVKFGDPMVFMRSQAGWNRQLNWPWRSFMGYRLMDFPLFYRVWFAGAGGLAIVLMALAWRTKMDRRHWVFGAMLMLFNFSANHLESIPRYLSVVFPLYLVFAAVPERIRPQSWLVVALSASLLTLSTVLFVNGFWFT